MRKFTYLILKAPRRGLLGLVAVSTPGNEEAKKSRYSFAILLNFYIHKTDVNYCFTWNRYGELWGHINLNQHSVWNVAEAIKIGHLSGVAMLNDDLDQRLVGLVVALVDLAALVAAAWLALLHHRLRAATLPSHLHRDVCTWAWALNNFQRRVFVQARALDSPHRSVLHIALELWTKLYLYRSTCILHLSF